MNDLFHNIQTKQYDHGYEDAIAGRKERSANRYYLRGYQAFLRLLDLYT